MMDEIVWTKLFAHKCFDIRHYEKMLVNFCELCKNVFKSYFIVCVMMYLS